MSPQSPTSAERLLEALGRVHRQAARSSPYAQQHVQTVDVDAVVGVAVREDDRGEVLDRDVLLQVRERAVAAVDPDRRAPPRTR